MPNLVYVAIITAVVVGSFFLGWRAGGKSNGSKSYFKGRWDGWQACEDLILKRAEDSAKIDLSKEELLEELIQ